MTGEFRIRIAFRYNSFLLFNEADTTIEMSSAFVFFATYLIIKWSEFDVFCYDGCPKILYYVNINLKGYNLVKVFFCINFRHK